MPLLGIHHGDVRTAAAQLDVRGGQRGEHEQDALEGDEQTHEVVRIAEPRARAHKQLVARVLALR